jgi:hypothetical protein
VYIYIYIYIYIKYCKNGDIVFLIPQLRTADIIDDSDLIRSSPLIDVYWFHETSSVIDSSVN